MYVSRVKLWLLFAAFPTAALASPAPERPRTEVIVVAAGPEPPRAAPAPSASSSSSSAPRRSLGLVVIGGGTVSGADAANAARAFAQVRNSLVIACYEAELVAQPRSSGRVQFTLWVGPTGKVDHIEAEKQGEANTLSAELIACASGKLRGLQFVTLKRSRAKIVVPVAFLPRAEPPPAVSAPKDSKKRVPSGSDGKKRPTHLDPNRK